MTARPNSAAALLAELCAALQRQDVRGWQHGIDSIERRAAALASAEAGQKPLPPTVDPRLLACVQAVYSVPEMRRVDPLGQLSELIAEAVLRAWLQQEATGAMGSAARDGNHHGTFEGIYRSMNAQAARELSLDRQP